VSVQLYCGDCLEVMATLPSASVDAVITDPPYPEIDREYGRMSEAAWWDMMMGVCAEVRRLLKPTGSAVFILQPNSRKVGSMRGWLWEFMAWVCREWNMVQDAWWWNTTTLPRGVAQFGLLRPSVKSCVWCGVADCYHNQDVVLWAESARNHEMRVTGQAEDKPVIQPSTTGGANNRWRMVSAAVERGGVTPFNLLPFPNANSTSSAGSNGHGAGTPLELAKWWTRYICPPGGVVLDPFVGSGTMMLAALEYGCQGIGIDKMSKYIEMARRRVEEVQVQMVMPL
jgi:DNA modification methylase